MIQKNEAVRKWSFRKQFLGVKESIPIKLTESLDDMLHCVDQLHVAALKQVTGKTVFRQTVSNATAPIQIRKSLINVNILNTIVKYSNSYCYPTSIKEWTNTFKQQTFKWGRFIVLHSNKNHLRCFVFHLVFSRILHYQTACQHRTTWLKIHTHNAKLQNLKRLPRNITGDHGTQSTELRYLSVTPRCRPFSQSSRLNASQ